VVSILAFGLLVISHEFGHFLVAKLNGVCVEEFSVGMGPRLLSHVFGETRYSLKLIPFGGSCMMLGEDEDNDDERAFNSKSVWARMAVLFAGPFFNFVFAFLLSLLLIGLIGIDKPIIQEVIENTPAQESGIQATDTILKLNDKKIYVYRDISLYLYLHGQETLDVTYERDGETYTTVITPQYNEDSGRYIMGLQFSGERTRVNVIDTIKYSLYEVKYWISYTFTSLKIIISGQVSTNEISGPVGLVSSMSSVVNESASTGVFYAFLSLVNFCILLSANLGVMNLLPIPALDGGRILFLIIEVFRGKPIDPNKEGMVHGLGFLLLIGLMFIVMFNDIVKLL
jgi:regulator of sigma E protease